MEKIIYRLVAALQSINLSVISSINPKCQNDDDVLECLLLSTN